MTIRTAADERRRRCGIQVLRGQRAKFAPNIELRSCIREVQVWEAIPFRNVLHQRIKVRHADGIKHRRAVTRSVRDVRVLERLVV